MNGREVPANSGTSTCFNGEEASLIAVDKWQVPKSVATIFLTHDSVHYVTMVSGNSDKDIPNKEHLTLKDTWSRPLLM